MHPSTHDALIRAWTTKPGAGNCAHFLIGRTPEQGIHQFCQITRNGNHAGGSNGHGWYRTPDGRLLHPNTVAVGIEVDNAGRLYRNINGVWMHADSNKAVDPADVYVDPRGAGWHAVTAYQFQALEELLLDLRRCLLPMPEGSRIVANGDHKKEGVPWAVPWGAVIAGHATLDPKRKSDPGPQLTAWLKEIT
jgi:N-acetyl-anhydromuramyl-L-alanine amidase AmpD